MNKYLDLGKEVAAALAAGKPVVALESTIISHGMPYPQNVETAIRVEDEIRTCGAVPATIAILGGRLKAGLEKEEIEVLGKRGREVVKASRRDLPRLVASAGTDRPIDGATTVAATMIVASLAGIKVFATGGIGGVHRGAESSFDISADLDEFASTEVAVVCAGAKSILDLPKTLEYLETKGVPVIGWRTDEFPAFYNPHSGLKLEERADEAADIARRLKAKWGMGLGGGVVIANPIPESEAMPKGEIDTAIEEALRQANAKGVKGKEVTPFLLAKVKELTSGESLESNIALVLNNARLASAIAVEYAKLK
jgi:pseudouridine-5'-phosphate glycosidase